MMIEDLLGQVQEVLGKAGIDLGGDAPVVLGGDGPLKVVCVSGRLGESLDAMQARPRDQVVMVRVDEGTLGDLDAWVETGALKSRSEAAALFIREGLQIRARELSDLRTAIDGVRKAKDELREAAARVLGEREEEDDDDGEG